MEMKILKKFFLYFAVMGVPFICGAVAEEVKNHAKTEQVAEQQDLLPLISQRLILAQDFAKVHWNQTLPIDNLDNEKLHIVTMQQQARDMGLDPAVVTSFFLAQQEAYKMVMMENFEVWVTQNTHKHDVSEDMTTLQTSLNTLDAKILQTMKADQMNSFSNKEALKVSIAKDLQSQGFSREVIDSATHF